MTVAIPTITILTGWACIATVTTIVIVTIQINTGVSTGCAVVTVAMPAITILTRWASMTTATAVIVVAI